MHRSWARRNKPRVCPDGTILLGGLRKATITLTCCSSRREALAIVRQILTEPAPRSTEDLRRRITASLVPSGPPLQVEARTIPDPHPTPRRAAAGSGACHGEGHSTQRPCAHVPDEGTVRIIRRIRLIVGERHILKARCVRCRGEFQFAKEA